MRKKLFLVFLNLFLKTWFIFVSDPRMPTTARGSPSELEMGPACGSVGPRSFFMKIQSLMNAGSWLPYNREMAVAFGADVAFLFSELCHLSEQYHSERMDGWFFVPSAKLAELTGMKRTQLERCLTILCAADLLMIDARGLHNTRHFKLEKDSTAISAACAAQLSAPAQTPDRAPKTPPRAKQTPNTAKECEPAPEPIGNTEQLPREPKPKKPKTDPAEIEAAAVRLIEHLNAVAGTAFRTLGKVNIEKFARVLKAKEGTEEEIRMVIELKTMQWGGKDEMKSHLNPETLTRPKNFPRYLEECYNAKNQINTPRPAAAGFAARDNNTIFNKQDARIAVMVQRQLEDSPGMINFLDPKYTQIEYLIALSESEIKHHLREAKRKWELSKYPLTNDDGLPF